MLRRWMCAALALMLCMTGLALAEDDKDRESGIPGVRIVEVDGLCGLRLDSGEWLLEPTYSWIRRFENGYAEVSMQTDEPEIDFLGIESFVNLHGLIDETGALVLPLERYGYVDDVREDGTVCAQLDGEDIYFALTPEGPVRVAHVKSEVDFEDYRPFKSEKLARLDAEPAWNLRDCPKAELPRLDGATALFPVYAAFAEAVYPEAACGEIYTGLLEGDETTPVACTTTNGAYERLIAGEVDMIFCGGPSDEQIEAAAKAGVEFELTPLGRDAFVFFVNAENPLENLSVSQIRQIYGGQITQWDELGVPGIGEIVAYQRPKNSGSQTALERLMGDTPMATAPSEYVADDMIAIVESVALDYRNLSNAIGYSFRFFCTEMMDIDVKLLSVEGIAPTVENIRGGVYPIATTGYAVTRKGETNPRVRALLDWITSDQGRELIEKSGYVSYAE